MWKGFSLDFRFRMLVLLVLFLPKSLGDILLSAKVSKLFVFEVSNQWTHMTFIPVP